MTSLVRLSLNLRMHPAAIAKLTERARKEHLPLATWIRQVLLAEMEMLHELPGAKGGQMPKVTVTIDERDLDLLIGALQRLADSYDPDTTLAEVIDVENCDLELFDRVVFALKHSRGCPVCAGDLRITAGSGR